MSLAKDIQVTLTDLESKKHILLIPTDMNLNLMEAIRIHELPIKATCGGMALCASCNIRITSSHKLPEMNEEEEAMLDEAFVLDEKGSRLACQIKVNPTLDGLKFELGELTRS